MPQCLLLARDNDFSSIVNLNLQYVFFVNCYIMQTIATVCMFLAGKVEETVRPLRDVVLLSYEIINKKDPAAFQRIRQKVR